jgi:hypothetical protein
MMAPTYTGAGLARPAPPKGWLATLVVLLVMVGLVALGFAAAIAVAKLPDKPITVEDGVVVTIPSLWEFAGRSDDGSAIQLTRGSGNVVIAVDQGTDVAATLKTLHDQAAAGGSVAVGDIVAVTDVRNGAPGTLRFAYSGTVPGSDVGGPVEGEVTGIPGAAVTVVFDAWAAKGNFVAVRGDVLSIIDETTIP